MTFGATIKQMREARLLGLREAARAIPLSPTYLCRMEQDKTDCPSGGAILKIAKLYGVPVTRLIKAAPGGALGKVIDELIDRGDENLERILFGYLDGKLKLRK